MSPGSSGYTEERGAERSRTARSGSRVRRWGASAALGAAAVLMGASSSVGQVELRGKTDAALSALAAGHTIKELSPGGVRTETPGLGEQIVAWDRVKKIGGEWATKFEPFAGLAETAWRARTRLEREDYALAEPLFESMSATLAGQTGPTAAFASEGLLRCRLARGAQAAAIVPWLTWTAIVAAPIGEQQTGRDRWIGGSCDLAPAIDAEYLLSPSLPPVWVAGPALDSLLASKEWDALAQRDGVAGPLAKLYRHAALLGSGPAVGAADVAAIAANSPGTMLVRDMVLAWAEEGADREKGRASLRLRVESGDKKKPATPKRWVEAWCRYAVGRSMIAEAEESTRLLGVIELLHVPARFEEDQPYLAGMALAQASLTLAEIGDARGAQALKAELASKFPRHPALEWDRVRKLPAAPAANRPAQ